MVNPHTGFTTADLQPCYRRYSVSDTRRNSKKSTREPTLHTSGKIKNIVHPAFDGSNNFIPPPFMSHLVIATPIVPYNIM